MNFKTKSLFTKALLSLFVITLMCGVNYGLVYNNWAESAFDEPEDDASAARSIAVSMSIQAYIVNGAGYFLAGYSDFLTALNRVELASSPDTVNYEELNKLLKSAETKMASALNLYSGLVDKANKTPYNPAVIDALVHFDYKSFRTQRNISGNNADELENLLANGDVRGVFERTKARTAAILEAIQRVKADASAGKFPAITDLWRVNQAFSETLLFGQYSAEIFAGITGKDK